MPNVKEWFAGEPMIGRVVGGPAVSDERDHFYVCRLCGQAVDKRDLAQVIWHEQHEHERLPDEIVYRISNASDMLHKALAD